MANKFTFKKVKKEGRYRSFDLTNTTKIKLNKKKVGYISSKGVFKDKQWIIHLMVKKERTTEHPAPFKWMILKKRCKSEEEARNFLNENFEIINKEIDLYLIEE